MNSLDRFRLIFPYVHGISSSDFFWGEKTENVTEFKDIKIYTENPISDSDKSLIDFYILKFRDEIIPESTYFSMNEFIETVKILNKEYKLEKLLKSIEIQLCRLTGSEGASILMLNKAKNCLSFFITSGGASGKIETIEVPIKGSVAGYIFSNNETFFSNDMENTPFHFKKTDSKSGFITENIIGTPIRYFDEVIGVLEAVNKPSGFIKQDIRTIELFAKIVSNKLLNAKLYEDISQSSKEVILSFATAIDLRDNYTHKHSQNVTNYAMMIAKYLKLPENITEELEISAIVHDIGKIGIPDEILNKKDKLTDDEFKIIKSHTTMGADILKNVDFINPSILSGPLEHHEKLDGTGYPYQKTEKDISLIGQILAVCDIFDALTSERPYKKPWSKKEALDFLNRDRDTKYKGYIIDALEDSLKQQKS